MGGMAGRGHGRCPGPSGAARPARHAPPPPDPTPPVSRALGAATRRVRRRARPAPPATCPPPCRAPPQRALPASPRARGRAGFGGTAHGRPIGARRPTAQKPRGAAERTIVEPRRYHWTFRPIARRRGRRFPHRRGGGDGGGDAGDDGGGRRRWRGRGGARGGGGDDRRGGGRRLARRALRGRAIPGGRASLPAARRVRARAARARAHRRRAGGAVPGEQAQAVRARARERRRGLRACAHSERRAAPARQTEPSERPRAPRAPLASERASERASPSPSPPPFPALAAATARRRAPALSRLALWRRSAAAQRGLRARLRGGGTRGEEDARGGAALRARRAAELHGAVRVGGSSSRRSRAWRRMRREARWKGPRARSGGCVGPHGPRRRAAADVGPAAVARARRATPRLRGEPLVLLRAARPWGALRALADGRAELAAWLRKKSSRR